jgi:hypothetical protein
LFPTQHQGGLNLATISGIESGNLNFHAFQTEHSKPDLQQLEVKTSAAAPAKKPACVTDPRGTFASNISGLRF